MLAEQLRTKPESVMSYATKVDFGDLDVLIEGGAGYDPTTIAKMLQATEVVRNGDVTSIGVKVDEGIFQVDLIKTPKESFDFTARYFGFNDFGNLVGRIAHKFGAKFGHLGLLYPIRDLDNSSFADYGYPGVAARISVISED